MKNTIKILSITLLVVILSSLMGTIHMNELDLLGTRLIPVLLICVAIFFVKKEIINTWWYSSLAFWIFFFVLLLSGNGVGGGGFGGGGIRGGGIAVFFLGWLYFFLSLIVIAVKSWKLRKG